MGRSGMGKDKVRGHQHVGTTDPRFPDESEIGSDMQGKNKLQGNDQKQVRNERRTMPDEISSKEKGPAQPRDIPRPKDRTTEK